MNLRLTHPDLLRIIRFCFRGTFVILGLAAINMIPGIAFRYSNYPIYSSYVLGAAILICVVVVNVYPILFLRELYKAQQKKRFRFGVFTFVLLNLCAGYVWFFARETKGDKTPWEHQWIP